MKKMTWAATAAAVLLVFVCAACNKHDDAGQRNRDVATLHNSQNSLDWWGVYRGVLPCADCDGIEIAITLNRDGTFKLEYSYLGKAGMAFAKEGSFKWSEDGRNITLDIQNFPPYFQVGEGRLWQLDMQGRKIAGKFADRYMLEKAK